MNFKKFLKSAAASDRVLCDVILVKRFFICSLTCEIVIRRDEMYIVFLTVAMLVFASDIQCGSKKAVDFK